MQEIKWKVIPEFDGRYKISSTGLVASKYLKGKNLSAWICGSGYYQVDLYKNGKRRKFCTHYLVAKAFLRIKKNKTYVNHKDGDKLNNDVRNLEWVTPSENSTHYHRELKDKEF